MMEVFGSLCVVGAGVAAGAGTVGMISPRTIGVEGRPQAAVLVILAVFLFAVGGSLLP